MLRIPSEKMLLLKGSRYKSKLKNSEFLKMFKYAFASFDNYLDKVRSYLLQSKRRHETNLLLRLPRSEEMHLPSLFLQIPTKVLESAKRDGVGKCISSVLFFEFKLKIKIHRSRLGICVPLFRINKGF